MDLAIETSPLSVPLPPLGLLGVSRRLALLVLGGVASSHEFRVRASVLAHEGCLPCHDVRPRLVGEEACAARPPRLVAGDAVGFTTEEPARGAVELGEPLHLAAGLADLHAATGAFQHAPRQTSQRDSPLHWWHGSVSPRSYQSGSSSWSWPGAVSPSPPQSSHSCQSAEQQRHLSQKR